MDNLPETTYQLYILDKNTERKGEITDGKNNVKMITGSLNDINAIGQILDDYGIDTVLHLASTLIPASTHEDFNRELEEIIIPTFGLLPILGQKKIPVIFFSSGGTVYGKAVHKIQENHKLEPINYYGYSKLMIENHIRLIHKTSNLNYLILRFSNVFGKYQRMNSEQGFITVALGKIAEGKQVEIWGDGENVRDYFYAGDISVVIDKLIRSGIMNDTFNVGSGEGTSLNEIIELFNKILGKKIGIVFKPKRTVDLDKVVLDISHIKSKIEFYPTKLHEGLLEYIEYLDNTYHLKH